MFSFLKKFFGRAHSDTSGPVSFVVFGIGNIGAQYHDTKHNIGFAVVDALLQNYTVLQSGQWCDCDMAVCEVANDMRVALAKPRTYVNRSGTALVQLMGRYNLPLSRFLVVVDDYNLPLGTIRLRPKGSHGGHNGLRSIIAEVGNEFPRLRVGIGPLPGNTDIVKFVLSPFDEELLEKKAAVVKKAAEGVVFFCENGIEPAMSKFNKKE